MVVPEPQDGQLSPSGLAGKGTSQQYRSIPSSSQPSGGPKHLSSNENISPVDASIHYEPQEYTETDFLLPSKLYGTSGVSGSRRAKHADGAGAPAETICSMVLQILVPFLLAGFGTVSAGMLLDVVQVRRGKKNKKWSGLVVISCLSKREMKSWNRCRGKTEVK